MASFRNTYEVLIASPSDLSEERIKIVQAISEWNFENLSKGIAFSPLLWEWNAVPDIEKTPQDAINEQLLSRADFIIAAFKGRLGTPTKDYPAGTIEELTKRQGKAAVYFPKDWPSPNPNLPNYKEDLKQLDELIAFKGQLSKNFAVNYDGQQGLFNNIKKLLNRWSDCDCEKSHTLVLLHAGPYDPKELLNQPVPKEEKVTLLLYNPELITLKTKVDFEKYWGFLREKPSVEKVVLLLPLFKIRRLETYLAKSTQTADPELLDKFYVLQGRDHIPQKEGSSSSLAFALLRFGTDPSQGNFAPFAHIAILAEPFSLQRPSPTGGPDPEWEYKYFFEFNEPQVQEKLGEVWDRFYQNEALNKISMLAENKEITTEIDNSLVDETSNKMPLKFDEALTTIMQLKPRLFVRSVPSYLLTNKFEILDWNDAFELVFDTTKFYRHESVKEYVEQLSSNKEAKIRGKQLMDADHPLFDLESLSYVSPKYGEMNFTKIASRVLDLNTGESIGWVVILNVNTVEKFADFEQDLKVMNEKHALIGKVAIYNKRIMDNFPGYLDLARLHATEIGSCHNILDLGCGTGLLSEELLKRDKQVTAIEENDAMLEAVRERCGGHPGFSLVKANLETLHKHNPLYAMDRVGIKQNYDGVVMFNSYHWLSDPSSFFKRLVDEKLLVTNGLLTISFLINKQDVTDLLDSIQIFKENQDGQMKDIKLWSNDDYENFSNNLSKMCNPNDNTRVIGLYSEEDVVSQLEGAGFKVIKRTRHSYKIPGSDSVYRPFVFIVAKRTR